MFKITQRISLLIAISIVVSIVINDSSKHIPKTPKNLHWTVTIELDVSNIYTFSLIAIISCFSYRGLHHLIIPSRLTA